MKEEAYLLAINADFSPRIVFNVIDAETGGTWDCSLKGKAGERGCLQIIPKFHPDVDPLNFEDSINYFISEYKAGRGWQWTSANCYAYASLFTKLPKMKEIVPNTTPHVGAVAIFMYNVKHIGIVTSINSEGFFLKESNYEAGKIGKRFIPWTSPSLEGFYSYGSP